MVRGSLRGLPEGGILLHDHHVQAFFPLDPGTLHVSTQHLIDGKWGGWPGPTGEGMFTELVTRMSALGALQPSLATLPKSLTIEHLEAGGNERPFEEKDLLPCPYCKQAARRGEELRVPRVRLPLGAGSDLAAFAAELAAADTYSDSIRFFSEIVILSRFARCPSR